MAVIYYSGRIQSKIGKGKRGLGGSAGKAGVGFQGPLPVESHTECAPFPQQRLVTTHMCGLPGKFAKDLVPRVFTGS